MKLLAGLPVYENLYALNRDFEQVLVDLTRLQKLGMLRQRNIGNTLRILVQEIRAWANVELAGELQPRVQGDSQIGKILLKGERVMDKNRRKESAMNRRETTSEGA